MKPILKSLAVSMVVAAIALTVGLTRSSESSSLAGWGYGSFGGGQMTASGSAVRAADLNGNPLRNQSEDRKTYEQQGELAMRWTGNGTATYRWLGATRNETQSGKNVVCARGAGQVATMTVQVDSFAPQTFNVLASSTYREYYYIANVDATKPHTVKITGTKGLFVDAVALAPTGSSLGDRNMTVYETCISTGSDGVLQ